MYEMSVIYRATLLWEEAQGSPVFRLDHTDLMPILDGDCPNGLVPVKNRKPRTTTFKGEGVKVSYVQKESKRLCNHSRPLCVCLKLASVENGQEQEHQYKRSPGHKVDIGTLSIQCERSTRWKVSVQNVQTILWHSYA